MALFLATLLGFPHFQRVTAVRSLLIDTTSGIVQGFINDTTPNVAQFLGIPFAEQPIAARRWLPPSPKQKQKRNDTIVATSFGPACPQFEADPNVAPNLYIIDAPEFNIYPQSHQGEDCLSVNVWTPWNETQNNGEANESFPVIAWLYGGAFTNGGASVPYQNPSPWIERSRKHIVVGINYRLGIFGFPNAAGLPLDQQNLGLLDQRLGLEWIRNNIANFGGDPDRITFWGQSAGAMSVDDYNFAYPDDTIIKGLIMNSGVSLLDLSNTDFEQTNFTFLAEQFDCGNSCAETEVECLRNVSSSSIISYLKGRADNGTIPSLIFSPIVDNRTLFAQADYLARGSAGNFTRKPAIIGTTTNEGIAFLPYNRTYGPSQADGDATTALFFTCPVVKTTQDRYAANATTFRYLYAGNFSNIAPQWWEGAYHSSDLPMIFGTYGIARGEGTDFQRKVSEKMQDYWLAFAEDPVNGLPQLGWDSYEPSGNGVLLGYNNQVVQSIRESALEAPCDGLMPNGRPLPP